MNLNTKVCTRCGVSKSLEDFPRFRDCRNGNQYRWARCRLCLRMLARIYRAKNREKVRIINRRSFAKYMANPANAERERVRNNTRRRELRLQFLRVYGGRCACCGLSDERFLTLDHTAGDGARHRREFSRDHYQIYAKLRREGWPKQSQFQVLCYNCNCAKSDNGLCPHQEAM